jgi:acetylornithine deacetylase/succinyl-diaminopimelate desuccinylase-like protein
MIEQAIEYAHRKRKEHLSQLVEFLRFPSVSTQPEHKKDIRKAADWLAADMRRIGLEGVQVFPTDGSPIVYGEWLEAGEDKPTLLIYGHYDVQPADPLEDWISPPFEPTIRKERVYARGASDNKGQHFSHLKAVESILQTNGTLPLNLKFCIDGEEEAGSPSLPGFIELHKPLLACDSILVSDGAMAGEGRPSIQYASRGIVDFKISVRAPGRDLHSGSYGGTVHNPAQALAEIISKLHDEKGRVTVPGFYDSVVKLTDEERKLLAKVNYTIERWQADTGARVPWGEKEYTLLERMTARPTLEVNGMWGGYIGDGMKTIIPEDAGAIFSCRLVPAQHPEEIAEFVIEHIKRLTPPTVEVEIEAMDRCAAAVASYKGPEIDAAFKAQAEVWQVEPVISRMGGSLPVVSEFQQQLGASFVLLPFGLDDNRHSPNEHYRLDYFYRGIESAIRYYYHLAEALSFQ